MPARPHLVSFAAALLVFAAPVPALHLEPADCDNPLPQVLDVGLPLDRERDPREVGELLRRVFERRYGERTICPGRPLQVNAALGSEYQILDWLGRGAVDAAIVSPLALHLLRRDGVDLLEMGELPTTSRGWLATSKAELRSFDLGEGRRRRSDPAGDLERFRLALLERARAGGEGKAKLPERLVLSSHLATAGFLVPVAETQRWLESHAGGDAKALRDGFWQQLFEHACFSLGAGEESAPACRELGLAGDASPRIELEVVAVPIAPGETLSAAPSFGFGEATRDHLVIRREEAQSIFAPDTFSLPAQALPADLAALFGSLPPDSGDLGRAPAVFSAHLQPEAYFGTRTFSFSVDEALRLLEQHQRTSARKGLALVLPGGGVKAAYQSRLIDTLYGERYLVNQLAGGDEASGRLGVHHVIGTSGGALLGYFVARLGAEGPFDLSRVLWFRRPAGEMEDVPLDSADVFGSTDLPRYVSLVCIFLIFAGGLALSSLGPRAFLSPERNVPSLPAASPSLRLPLLLPLGLIVAGTPVLVRWVSGELVLEHVPEFEGLLFAILLVSAMFADQCLVERPGREVDPAPAGHRPVRTFAAGILLMSVPVLARFFPGLPPVLEAKLGFGFAYLGLGALTAVLMYLAIRRHRGAPLAGWELWLGALIFVSGSAIAYKVLRFAGEPVLAKLDRTPLLFLGLGVTLVVVVLIRVARGGADTGWLGWVQDQLGQLRQGVSFRRSAQSLALLVACFLMLDLTRPEARVFSERSLGELLTEPSKLDLPLGALAVCVGALFAVFGWLRRLARRTDRFQLEQVGSFVDAVLLVFIGLATIVYLVLFAISRLWPGLVTLFELTPQFWIWLVVVSGIASGGLLLWARWGRRDGPFSRHIGGALVYLCGHHPNAHLASRRFVRLLVVAVGGLLWWNFLLAPGLYGNRSARNYLTNAEARFAEALAVNPAPPGQEQGAVKLTTRLLATANALETDGTRFFLVVPGAEPCPVIQQPPGSGSTWFRYHAIEAGAPHAADLGVDPCRDLRLEDPEALRTLRAFVFASGSPFPIFPAHRVELPGGRGKEALVDGGYSNNTPVEAAGRVGSERVLVVNSSNPLPAGDACGTGGWFTGVYGPLVDNALRLPGFLFERAQQLDRRSRADLFVVSLSPPLRCDWPLLSDFSRTTVSRMVRAAELDLGLRIGRVESWGPPRFQVSVQVSGLRPGAGMARGSDR